MTDQQHDDVSGVDIRRTSRPSVIASVWRVIRTSPGGTLGAGVLIVAIGVAVLAPWVAPYEERAKVGPVFAPPSRAFLLGLDDAGADMLSLMIYGARISLLIGFAAALIAMVIGSVIGLIAGYFGGKTDLMLMRLTDYMLVLPDVPLMLVAAAVWGRSLGNTIIIIGVLYWAFTARLIRSQTKTVRERTYVRRVRALGAGHSRILFKHILPQVAPLLVATTVLRIGLAIFAETAIAFLGLGDPTRTSWGRLIQNAFEGNAISNGAWWAIVPPGVAVGLVVLSCTLIGRELEETLNPRLRNSYLSVHSFRTAALRLGEDQEKPQR